MSDLEDRYLAMLVINEIDDPVTPLSYPVTVGISGELFRAVRPGIPGKGLIRWMMRRRSALVPAASSSLPAELLINSLYAATPFQALNKGIEGKALLVLPFGEFCDIVIGVLGQASFYGIVDHIGDGTIRCGGLQT
jgi:hypothetical protein